MLSNLDLAELLARRGDEADQYRRKAYHRAAGAALAWPVEVHELLEAGIPLTDLPGLGDRLAGRIEEWMADPPEVPEPPPSRAGFVTLAWARARLADEQAWRDRLHGDLQMHTTFSDGKNDLLEMAATGTSKGYAFIAVTDHSGGQPVPPGMNEAAMARQHKAIDGVNEKMGSEGFRVIKGIEMNLDITGKGDVEHDVLSPFELVLGSFHSKLRVSGDQTDRYLGAVRNPSVDVLAHPTARRYNRRPGLEADWDVVFDAAVESGTAIEIDAHPHRGDVPIEIARVGVEKGVTFSIGSDAHDPSELDMIEVGLAIALEAGIDPGSILSFGDADRVIAWSSRA